MGLYDREYAREDDDVQGGNFWATQSVTTLLVVANVAVFLADAIFSPDHWLMNSLAIDPASVAKPWMWWQFVTAGFAHEPNMLNHILGNMFGLWVFGSVVEQVIGKREFLRFYLVAIVIGNVAFALRQYFFVEPRMFMEDGVMTRHWAEALGASGGVTAVIVLFVCMFPKQTLLLFFVIPVPAWLVGVLIIGMDVFGSMRPAAPGQPQVAHDVHLTGAAFAFLYWRFGWKLAAFDPTNLLSGVMGKIRQPKLKVHAPEPTYEDQDAEADRLLDKVHRDGEQSLTARERRVLEDYARRMRQKLR